jgi:HD-like signal output (HDOD) protein
MPSPVVERIAKLVSDLPPLPAVAQQALSLLNDPTTEPEELQSVLSKDPALALKVLGMSNSAYYRRGRAVTTLSGAVVVLGFKTIQTLVLSSAVHRVISTAGDIATQLWEHSFAAGVATRELSKHVGHSMQQREEAFLAGLFHDVAKGVIASKFPGVYAEPLGVTGEVETLGFHHSHLAHVLLVRWEIPQQLALAVAGHHEPASDGLARLTTLGDGLAWRLAPGVGAPDPGLLDTLCSELNLDTPQFEDLEGRVRGFLTEERGQA